MEEQSKYKKMVMLLAEISEKGNLDLDEEITNFEDAIKKAGNGEAYFGIAKSDWERIEIIKSGHIPFRYKNEGVKFYAEYYDGNQAPFTVCKWCNDFYKMEELLRNTSDVLYKKYREIVNEERSKYNL